MEQPFSYQTLPASCWVTSVTNGLLHIYGDKDRIPGLALRLLHSVLTDEGVQNGSGKTKADWEIVLGAVTEKCGLDLTIIHQHDNDVETVLKEKVDFSKSVVICDVGAGSHSVLIASRSDDWFYGFDPDWNQVKCDSDESKGYIFFPLSTMIRATTVTVKKMSTKRLKKRNYWEAKRTLK